MSKTQEFKVYGSIRKMKAGGACGVILALGILGMGLQGTVSADEVSTDKTVAVEKKTEVEVPIAHDNLDKAVAEAKDAGVKVEVGAVQDKGVATSETVAEKQKEIEADYAKQEKEVKTVTVDYSSRVDKTTKEREVIEQENKAKQEAYEKAVDDHKAEVKRIEAENKAILADNDKKQKEIEGENARIERDNAKKLDDYKQAKLDQENANKQIEVSNNNAKDKYDKDLKKYNKDLAIYNEQKAKLEKLGLVGSSTGVKLYGDYNVSGRGSLDFYKNFHAVFEGVKDLEVVDGYLSASPKTEVKYSRKDLFDRTIDSKEGETGFFLKNIKKGDYFTLNNIGRTESGKSILAKFTFTSDPVPEFKVKGNDNIQPRMSVSWSKNKPNSAFDISSWNYQITDLDIEYFDQATGKPINLAYVNVLNDLDYDQMYRYEYQDGSTGILKIHPDSELTKVVENGKEFFKGTVNPVKFTYDDTSGLGDYSVGSILGTGVLGESSVPKGSLLSIGWGSKNHLTYTASRYSNWVGTNNTRPESHYYAYKAYLEEIAKKEGKPAPTDLEITHAHGYTFGLWGVNSSIQRPFIKPVEPVKPELKQKDTKEIPKPKLEKPKEFVPRTTLPTPPAPTPPEKKKIPGMPLPANVKVNYSRLRVTPSTPKPVKAIKDTYKRNIDGSNTFDKNVKFSLTTDYKPYSTFTTDSKTYGKTWAMVDDVQDGAYKVDDSKITMKDSTGKDVKALFNMYHVLSEKERTQEIQNILKEAGLNPKGEFYMFVAKDSASFYKNYVKQAKNITIDLPARLLVEKGKVVKNDFHQIDFGNSFVSNLVTVEVPDLKPEKHAVDQKDDKKVLDGQEVQIGQYIRYLLDGVTVPTKHDSLFQYDGSDQLDVVHDRFTGKWSGIFKGTEYTAEQDLILHYDVILKDGKVVKAGDKILKGTSYAFLFEVNQDTNPDFLKKIVAVKWDEKAGKWSYVINQDFLNSLGVKGSFDADFYIEVERISAGKVENTFINTVNLQEMTAKVTTTTPEPPKPEKPGKPNPQPSLPNTGSAASMLPVVGMILGLLSLAGLRKYKK